MKIGLIGLGAIGSVLAAKIQADQNLKLVFVCDIDSAKLATYSKKLIAKTIHEMKAKRPDLVVEAAGHEAVKVYAENVMKFSDFLPMSTGALVDEKFLERLRAIGKKNRTKLFLPPGAIIGLDGIEAVREQLHSVTIESRKNPKGFGRDDNKETVLFEGTAKEGCPKFPKNINVSATLSLYGIGPEKTKARLVSDPDCTGNTHLITAEGEFGKFTIRVENKPSANPKTSGLAALSAFSLIKRIEKGCGYF